MAPKKKSAKIVATTSDEQIREPAPIETIKETDPPQSTKRSPIMDSMKPLFKSTILRFIREDKDIQDAIVSLVGISCVKADGRKRSASIKPADSPPPPPPPPPCPYTPPKMTIADYLKSIIYQTIQYDVFVDISEVEEEDLEYILANGFVEGFVHLINKNLYKLDSKHRPIKSFRRDYSAIYIKTGPKSWKKETENFENLTEMVFGFSQKVDIKIVELYGGSDKEYEIRRQASGGIDRIKHIETICRRIADSAFVVNSEIFF